MTAIFALIENTEKMRKYLFWYLMIIPALLLLWIALGAANSQMDFQAALKIPFFTVAFLNACLSLLLGGTLKFAGAENERTERAYALYLTILLVIIGNLPGAILSFFLFRSPALRQPGRRTGTQVPLGASARHGLLRIGDRSATRCEHRNVVEVNTPAY